MQLLLTLKMLEARILSIILHRLLSEETAMSAFLEAERARASFVDASVHCLKLETQWFQFKLKGEESCSRVAACSLSVPISKSSSDSVAEFKKRQKRLRLYEN